jgi:hypothetical protein
MKHLPQEYTKPGERNFLGAPRHRGAEQSFKLSDIVRSHSYPLKFFWAFTAAFTQPHDGGIDAEHWPHKYLPPPKSLALLSFSLISFPTQQTLRTISIQPFRSFPLLQTSKVPF